MSRYLIELREDGDASDVNTHALERLAVRTLEAEAVAAPAELSVLLSDDATVRRLNRTYRQTDAATDVLSFSQADGEAFAHVEGTAHHLGDVVISLDTARRQAGAAAISLHDEVAHLLVHGILHLLGYDHEEPADATLMRQREEALLGSPHHH